MPTIVQQIESALENNKSFVLSGGAGSGKTHSLKEVINSIYGSNPNAKIACITFTEVASNEIAERCKNTDRNLWVSTIHKFLWENIKNYKPQLKKELIELIKADKISYHDDNDIEEVLKDKVVDYGISRKISEGLIWHDDLLLIAKEMFAKYKLLNKIFSDKYDYVFIDEYQDTSKDVIEIFINMIKSNIRTKFGFFGDSMQAIYETGIGSLTEYVQDNTITEIKKADNYRCSVAVIELCNKIRNDGIIQKPSNIENGEIKNKPGCAVFVYSDNDLNAFEQSDLYNEIFENISPDKELYLTYKLISKKHNFIDLLNAYIEAYGSHGREKLMGENKDDIAKFLNRMAELIYLYKSGRYNEFIQKTSFDLKSHSFKLELRNAIETAISEKDIEWTVNFMAEKKLLIPNDNLKDNMELWNKVKTINFEQAMNIYNLETDHTPYSTQHGVKGAEFNNVLVVLDNGNWFKYNFNKLFSPEPPLLTLKLFYVCISRAKNNLAVFMQNPDKQVLLKAIEWFGEENVKKV